MEGLNFGGAVGGFRSSFHDQDMVDTNHVSPKVPLVTVEKGMKLKRGSKVVITQMHEKPKSMLPWERPSPNPFIVHASLLLFV